MDESRLPDEQDDVIRQLKEMADEPGQSDPQIPALLGTYYLNQDKLDDAVKYLKRAVALRTPDPDHYMSLGCALARKGAHGEAFPYFQFAADADPGDKYFQYNLARAHMTLGHIKESIECNRKTLALDPGMHPAKANLAYCLYLVGDLAAARPLMEEMVETEPVSAKNRLNLALLHIAEEDYGSAEKHLTFLKKHFPRIPVAEAMLAKVYMSRGQYFLALGDSLENTHSSNMDDAIIFEVLGDCCRGKGDTDMARDFYDAAIGAAVKTYDSVIHKRVLRALESLDGPQPFGSAPGFTPPPPSPM